MNSEMFPDLVKLGVQVVEVGHEALQPYFHKRRIKAEIEADSLKQQFRHDYEIREAFHQAQLCSIYNFAIPILPQRINPDSVDQEWMYNFCDKAKFSTQEEMQVIWAKILAGEVTNPGSFSKITIQTIANLEKEDADLFTKLCRYNFNFEGYDKIVHYDEFETLKEEFGDFLSQEELYHLEYLGLISYSDNGFMAFDNVIIKVQYFGKNFQLVLADKKNHQLTTGYILLSKTGKELLPICGAEPFDYYLELIINAWKKRDIESFKFIDQ